MRFELATAVAVLLALGCNGAVPGSAAGAGASTGGRGSTRPGSTAPTTSSLSPVTSGTRGGPGTTPGTTPPGPGTGGTGGTTGSSNGSGGMPGVNPGQPAYGRELITGNAASRYSIYIPSGYVGAPTGLVLAFHGVEGTATPNSWFDVCALVADNDRFIVVAPYGDVNDGGSGAWTQPYAAEILDLVRTKFNVNLKKQYIAAISGGCLPGVFFALGDTPKTYKPVYGNYTVKAGFQSDFAAVGFSSPAYSPSDPDFAALRGLDAAALRFTPAFWADYGALSTNKPRADDLAAYATMKGYAPVKNVPRPGEGHAPAQPFSFVVQMFDTFAATSKP